MACIISMGKFKALRTKTKHLRKILKRENRYCDVIFNKNWARLIGLMENSEYRRHLKKSCTPLHFHYFNYLSMIHLACMMKAPLYVIVTLVNTFPSSVIMPDKIMRLPLHIACKYGACAEVIKFLIGKNPGSVNNQDIYGKTPLHLACEYRVKENGEMNESFKLLMKASPTSLGIRDSKGMSVLDYAIHNNLEVPLIQIIEWEVKKQNELDLSIIDEEGYYSEESTII